MSKKASNWGTGQYRLQVYLSGNLKDALDKYVAEKFSSDSRMISAIVRGAVAEFLIKEGYLERQEVKK